MADGSQSGAEFGGVRFEEAPGRGVTTFAARDFHQGDVVLEQTAIIISAVAAPDGPACQLWEALLNLEKSRRLPVFHPSAHIGALTALRDLGPAGCRARLLTLCVGSEPEPTKEEAKREVAVLRAMQREGLIPQAAASFLPAEYVYLQRVVKINGFRFNGDLREGQPGYDCGEVLFDKICRINHSCAPNLVFVTQGTDVGSVRNQVSAKQHIAAGEEVFISYLERKLLEFPVIERRKKNRAWWGFDCDCLRCQAELSALPPVEREAAEERKPALAAKPFVREECLEEATTKSGASDASSEAGICWEDLRDPEGVD